MRAWPTRPIEGHLSVANIELARSRRPFRVLVSSSNTPSILVPFVQWQLIRLVTTLGEPSRACPHSNPTRFPARATRIVRPSNNKSRRRPFLKVIHFHRQSRSRRRLEFQFKAAYGTLTQSIAQMFTAVYSNTGHHKLVTVLRLGDGKKNAMTRILSKPQRIRRNSARH